MMMIPRAYGHTRTGRKKTDSFCDTDEKRASSGSRNTSRERSRDRSRDSTARSRSNSVSGTLSRKSSDASLNQKSTPVQIPLRSAQRSKTVHIQTQKQPTIAPQSVPSFRESPKTILSSTTIPARRKPKPRATQRLPNCDYVADFSKLLLDDVKPPVEGSLSGSFNNPQFEGLFGNIDELVEGQMFVGSAGLDAGILTTRSISTDSLSSFVAAEDMSPVDMASPPSFTRSPVDRRSRRRMLIESCPDEHPLIPEDDDFLSTGPSSPERAMSPSPIPTPRRKATPSPAPDKKQSSFKSSLTASLKALKSAAQSVSNIAAHNPMSSQEDLVARSFFDIQPSLTDDRRPPPSFEPPSPALRRYLNPRSSVPADSPAQLHFWLEHRTTPAAATSPTKSTSKPKLKIKKKYLHGPPSTKPGSNLPSVVPLATCIPPAVRTAHASSPPIWLAPDGTPSNKHTAQPSNFGFDLSAGMPRHREPRENRDFLRIFVAEMNMRKCGKLSENAEGRACLWLPPVQEVRSSDNDDGGNEGRLKDGTNRKISSAVLGVGARSDDASTPIMTSAKKASRERWTAWSIDDLN